MSHPNAPLTSEGRRRLAVLIVEDGWTIRRAAERFQISPATPLKWAKRYRAGDLHNFCNHSRCVRSANSTSGGRQGKKLAPLEFQRCVLYFVLPKNRLLN